MKWHQAIEVSKECFSQKKKSSIGFSRGNCEAYSADKKKDDSFPTIFKFGKFIRCFTGKLRG